VNIATFTVENVWAKLTTSDEGLELSTRLDKEFAYFVDGYKYMQPYKDKRWDGRKHLYSIKTRRFPSGLLDDALAQATSYGYKVVLKDNRVRPDHPVKPWNLFGAEKREHQTEAYEAAIKVGRGIIHHATGAGKTEVMAAIIQMLDLPAIVMVDQTTIAKQTRDRFAIRLGRRKRLGLIIGERKQDGDVVCASFQSLMSQYETDKENGTHHLEKWLAKFDVLCLDEAHHAKARTYQTIINLCPAYYRFGFSATPFKSGQDKKSVV
jgi:superfamily II DNA or RNA helicase